MTDLRTAVQQAIELICSARLCIVNSMSSRQESLRLMIEATETLRAALTEPVHEPVADRAAFERHAERLGYSVDPDTREGREGGYWSSHTQLMWLTWQAALAEPVQEPVWVCPDSVEHRYRKPGHCEDCNKTLVQMARPVHEPVAWRYSTMGTWVYVDTNPILWQDKPDGEVQPLCLQQTTVCLSEEKNDAMFSEDSTTK